MIYISELKRDHPVPDGLGVRIPGFHPGGPGSIPGLGVLFDQQYFTQYFSYMSDQIIPERIYNYYPDVKVIMLLCEPEHRTLSHFLHAVSLRDIHFNHAYLDKFGSYSDVINDGFNTMLTDYPEILSDLSDISKPFTRFADLRDAVYR